MSSAHPTDLSALRRGAAAPTSARIERPPSRLLTRVGVPAAVILAALGLLAYAARESFRPAIAVSVAAVVPRAGGGTAGSTSSTGQSSEQAPVMTPGETVQAPGWIEADPSAFGVAALEEGVVKELKVLDGDRVEAGQVVATLVDEDAVLTKRQADAEVARTAAVVAEAEAGVKAADALVTAEQAKMDEVKDAYQRVETLSGKGLIAEEEIATRRLRLASMTASVEASRSSAATARAAVAKARAEHEAAGVARERAALTLSRMTVTASRAGVVLQRMTEPGQRLMRDANNPHAGIVVRLYDPARLQIRIDVPLADAAKVREGDAVEVSTEALPGRVFKGVLTRFVHEANLTKNTVQVKASITDPVPQLKPDMLTKARIVTRGVPRERGGGGGSMAGAGDAGVLIAPRAALLDATDTAASVWLVLRESSTVTRRSVKLGTTDGENVEVLDGLHPGDRVVLTPPNNLTEGAKVRPTEGAAQ